MAEFSMCLRDIYNDKNYKLFDFPYPFYDDALRSQFEAKFFEWYMFDEIGYPTPAYFKQRLKAHLLKKMPYYVKLYETEMAAKEINFLLNKDLKETFIKEIESTGNMTTTISSTGNNASTHLGMFSDTPQGTITDIEKYMSNANKDNNTTTYSDNNNSQGENTATGTEKTELLSQGNIGITSSAELLEKWRNVIINIDEMILEELSGLFIQVY